MTLPENPLLVLDEATRARLARVRVVLVRPLYAGNVGAVARAMNNMGMEDLVLVAPQCSVNGSDAMRMATGSHDLLERARTVEDVASALGDCAEIVAFTARFRAGRQPPTPVRELVPALVPALDRGPVALLFGPEDLGLSNEDMVLASRTAWIPTAASQRSLNLSQAVLIGCHELFIAMQEGRERPVRPRADLAQLQSFRDQTTAVLERVGFLNPQNPAHVVNALWDILVRAELDPRELAILRGVVSQVTWKLDDLEDEGP